MSLADTDENILITTRIRFVRANVFISSKNKKPKRETCMREIAGDSQERSEAVQRAEEAKAKNKWKVL